jgi:hypothetical protein
LIVEIAEYLQAQQVLLPSLSADIMRLDDDCKWVANSMAMYPEVAADFLSAANKLQLPALFRDALIMCLGPYHSPALHRITDPKLKQFALEIYNTFTVSVDEVFGPVQRAMLVLFLI